jgi:hypothetical protein
MAAANYKKLADRLDQEAQEMDRRNEQLGDQAAQVREDWERKRADPNVPGAPSPEESSPEGGSPKDRSSDAAEGAGVADDAPNG